MSSSCTAVPGRPEKGSRSSSRSSSGSNEPGGSEPVPSHVLSNNPKEVSEMKRCHVTGFVNFVEARPFVGRFKPDQEQLPSPASLLHLTAGSPPRLKVADIIAPSLAPACNYGVFNPDAARVSQR